MLAKPFERIHHEIERRNQRKKEVNLPIKLKNFFELKNENLKVFITYKAIIRRRN